MVVVGEAGAREWCFAVLLHLMALLGRAALALLRLPRGRARGLLLGACCWAPAAGGAAVGAELRCLAG